MFEIITEIKKIVDARSRMMKEPKTPEGIDREIIDNFVRIFRIDVRSTDDKELLKIMAERSAAHWIEIAALCEKYRNLSKEE